MVLNGQKIWTSGAHHRGALPLILMTELYATVTLDLVAKLALELIDADALGTPTAADAAFAGDPETASYWLHQTFIALIVAIGGGTSNIQRNIVGEQVLGLPRAPGPGSDGSRRRSSSPG